MKGKDNFPSHLPTITHTKDCIEDLPPSPTK